MGSHKPGQVSIGAFVEIELREYLDKLVDERGYLVRSDALRAVLREHKAVFSEGIDRNEALTPLEAVVNDNHPGYLYKRKKSSEKYTLRDYIKEMKG